MGGSTLTRRLATPRRRRAFLALAESLERTSTPECRRPGRYLMWGAGDLRAAILAAPAPVLAQGDGDPPGAVATAALRA
jgi:hypothetical protein